jgi:hypothetical protein
MTNKVSKIVSQAFQPTNDFRVGFNLDLVGASNLISPVFYEEEAIRRRFYSKPEIAQGDETKVAIIYGEALISPYIIDMGVSPGPNDPSSIQRTIRFIMGDGENEGVVVGPNGSELENVYLGGQPVVNSSGRPSLRDIALSGFAGGALAKAIPAIWDAISDAAEKRVGDIDPVTGKPMPSKAEQDRAALLSNIALDDLSNVEDNSDFPKGRNWVLAWDACSGVWIPKSLNEILNETVDIDGACGGDGGSGGSGGAGGAGGDGGSGGGTSGDSCIDTPLEVDTSPIKETCEYILASRSDMVQLVPPKHTLDNTYFEQFDATNTNRIRLVFYTDKIGNGRVYDSGAMTDDNLPCITNVDNAPGVQAPMEGAGAVEIEVCLSVNLCGQDFIIYREVLSEAGFHNNGYQFTTAWVEWASTPLGAVISQAPRQALNSLQKVNIHARRIDGLSGISISGGAACSEGEIKVECPKSKYPVYYQGMIVEYGDGWRNSTSHVKPRTSDKTPKFSVPSNKNGNFFTIDRGPNGTVGAISCPIPNPSSGGTASPGTPGESGESGSEGNSGGAGQCGTVEVAPPRFVPLITPNRTQTANVAYCRDNQNNWLSAELEPFSSLLSGNPDNKQVTITVELLQKLGSGLSYAGSAPGVNFSVSSDEYTLTITGEDSVIHNAFLDGSIRVVFIPDEETNYGTQRYRVSILNSDNECNGYLGQFVPCSLVVDTSNPANAVIRLQGTGLVHIWAQLPDGSEKRLTGVPQFFTDADTVAGYVSLASSINSNVQGKNALGPSNPDWLPLFVAQAAANELRIQSPVSAADEFNGLSLRVEVLDGNISVDGFGSILDFFGGVVSNVNRFLQSGSFWGNVSNILLAGAGAAAGAVAANVLLQGLGLINLSIPDSDKETTVTFLYRGRKVRVPASYNGAARTGAQPYSAFNGVWKNEWTSNPAWCILDFIETRTYGLGFDIPLTISQRDDLYRDIFDLAIYCDQLVEENKPRYSLNTVITSGTKMEVLEQLCSVVHGGYVFYKGGLRIVWDKPDSSIKLLVSQSNTTGFNYAHSTLKNFANKVEVLYVEPGSFYNQESVSVESTRDVTRFGEKTIKVVGFGITDRNQALRYGSWLLNSEYTNALVVSYVGGWDHYRLTPGDIVMFEDSNERGKRLGGRVNNITGNTITVDGDTDIAVGMGISVTQLDGSIWDGTITGNAGVNQWTLSGSPTTGKNNTFIAYDNVVGKQLYRVVTIEEVEDGKFNTVLQKYSLDKYSKITASTRI